jgi:hypothetical protein
MGPKGPGMADDALSYQEILRTLGTLLDQSGSDSATLVLSAQGAAVQAPSWTWTRVWSREALAAESANQRSWRARPRPPQLARTGRFNRVLRVVGAALDAEGGGPYTLLVDEEQVRVRSEDGAERVFEAKPLERRLKLAAHLRGQL